MIITKVSYTMQKMNEHRQIPSPFYEYLFRSIGRARERFIRQLPQTCHVLPLKLFGHHHINRPKQSIDPKKKALLMILTLLKDNGSKYKSRIIKGKTSISHISSLKLKIKSSGGIGRYSPNR